MKPLLLIVATTLVITVHAHENTKENKTLPQTKEPLAEADTSEQKDRKQRCSACDSQTNILAAVRNLPNAEVHTQSSFEECSSDKGCAGLKVKDGKIIEKFGNLEAFNAAASADTKNEFKFHLADSNFFGTSLPDPFWWMNQDSPFKGNGKTFEKYSKSTSSFSTSGGVGLGNSFFNGDFGKLGSGSNKFSSSRYGTASKQIDLTNNPYLNAAGLGSGGNPQYGASGAGGAQNVYAQNGASGSGGAGGGQFGYAGQNGASGSGGAGGGQFGYAGQNGASGSGGAGGGQFGYAGQNGASGSGGAGGGQFGYAGQNGASGSGGAGGGQFGYAGQNGASGSGGAGGGQIGYTGGQNGASGSGGAGGAQFGYAGGQNVASGSVGAIGAQNAYAAQNGFNGFGAGNQGFPGAQNNYAGGTQTGLQNNYAATANTQNSQSSLGTQAATGVQSGYGSNTASQNGFGSTAVSQNSQNSYGSTNSQGAYGATDQSLIASQSGIGLTTGSQSNFGSGQTAFGSNQAASRFGAGASTGFAGAGSNVNLIQNTQKSSEFDYQSQTVDEAFQNTGNVQAVENSGGDYQQTCAGQGYVCVPRSQCNNGVVNTNGGAVIPPNSQKQYCNLRSEICCRLETALTGAGSLQGVGFSTSQGTSGFSSNNIGSTAGASFNTNQFEAGSTLTPGNFGSTQSNFLETDSFSSASETSGVFGSGTANLNPVIPYIPPEPVAPIIPTLPPVIQTPPPVIQTLPPVIPTLPPVIPTIPPTFISNPRPIIPQRPVAPRPTPPPRPYIPPVPSTSAPAYLPPVNSFAGTNQPVYNDGGVVLDSFQPPPPPVIPRPVVPAPIDIPAGCAAALKCTPIEFCTAEGVISTSPVSQQAFRVPLTDCKDIQSGRIGKCCRDPFYTDPWPSTQLGKWIPEVFGGNDGKYVSNRENQTPRRQLPVTPNTGGVIQGGNIPSQPQPAYPGGNTFVQKQFGQGSIERGRFGSSGGGIQQFAQGTQRSFSQNGGRQQSQGSGVNRQGGSFNSNRAVGVALNQGTGSSRGSSASGVGTSQGGGYGAGIGYVAPNQGSAANNLNYGQRSNSQGFRTGNQGTAGGRTSIGTTAGFGASRGQGQGIRQGQGFGQGVSQGQGFNQGQGNRQAQGFGQGQGLSQGQGVGFGPGQSFSQGRQAFGTGAGSVQGAGYLGLSGLSRQGYGRGGFGQQGLSQALTQGQSKKIRGGGRYAVESGERESAYRVFLKRYEGTGQCGVLNPQKPYGNRQELEVDFAEIPWQAMVLLKTNKTLLCGGVITRPDVVVTSASCVEGFEAKNVLIKGGEWKLGIDDEPLPFQIVQVKHILRHPLYQPGSLVNDAAVLVLTENLRLAKNIWPICLPTANDTLDAFYNGAGECIVTGWGKQVLQSHLEGSIMHSVDVSLSNPGQCQSKLTQDYPHLLEHYSQDSCVCGQPKNPVNNICKVDIGSALACTTDDRRYVLRGIYSWDSSCQTGNQVATFYKFDLEWYEWSIGIIESVRFTQYSKITKKVFNQVKTTRYSTGTKAVSSGVKGFTQANQIAFKQGQIGLNENQGQIGFGTGQKQITQGQIGLSQNQQFTQGSFSQKQFAQGQIGSGSVQKKTKQGQEQIGVSENQGQIRFGAGEKQIKQGQIGLSQNQQFTQGASFSQKQFAQSQIGSGSIQKQIKQEQGQIGLSENQGQIGFGAGQKQIAQGQDQAQISNLIKGFTNTQEFKFQNKGQAAIGIKDLKESSIKGQVGQFSDFKRRQGQRKIETDQTSIVKSPISNTFTTTYSEKKYFKTEPKIVTFTTKPEIITYTTKPEIVINYETSASKISPTYVVHKESLNKSFSEIVGAKHEHSDTCKCLENDKK